MSLYVCGREVKPLKFYRLSLQSVLWTSDNVSLIMISRLGVRLQDMLPLAVYEEAVKSS